MMKKILFLIFSLPLACFAQSYVKPPQMKLIKGEDFQDSTVQSFWMSNEISIAEFNAFIRDLKNSPNDSLRLINYEYNLNQNEYEAIAMKIPYSAILSMKIDSAFAIKGTSVENYFTDKKFQNYPML